MSESSQKLSKRVSEELEEIQKRRAIEDLAIMIYEKYSEIERKSSTEIEFSLKVEKFFKFSSEWKDFCEAKKGEHPAILIDVKEKMIGKMDGMIEDVLTYINLHIKEYEFYVLTSKLTEGNCTEQCVWGNEYEFVLEVKEVG